MTTLARHLPTRAAGLVRLASEVWAWAQHDPHARIFARLVRLGFDLMTCGFLEIRRNGPHLGPVSR